jgi:hypothetical protein
MNPFCYYKKSPPEYSDQFGKYRYLQREFSIINENEIDFIKFQDVFNGIRIHSETPIEWKYSLCVLYSVHLFESPGFFIKNISQYQIDFLCSILIPKGERDDFVMYTKYSKSLDDLLYESIRIIDSHFGENLIKFPTLWELFQPGDFQDTTRVKITDFFEKYIHGDYDHVDFSKHLCKWMIQIQLHLLKFEKAISYYNSLSFKNSITLFNRQPDLGSSGHIFIRLIENFKPFFSRFKFDKNGTDPIICGSNTLLSIFYNLVEITKLLTTVWPYDYLEFLDNLIYTFYTPFLLKINELKPEELLQLASVSEFSFQYFIVHILSGKKPSFKILVQNLKAFKTELDSDNDINVIINASDCTNSIVEGLLKKPILSLALVDWKQRKALISFHLNFLSKANLQVGVGLRWLMVSMSIQSQIEKYTFLLNFFSIVSENQINFQKLYDLYKSLVEGPISTSDSLASLLSLYSFHFINYGTEELAKFKYRFIGRLSILMDQIGSPDINRVITLSPKELVTEARKIVEGKICEQLTNAIPNCNLLKRYFKSSKVSSLSIEAISILRIYAEDTSDKNGYNLGVNKRLINVYQILLRYEKELNL